MSENMKKLTVPITKQVIHAISCNSDVDEALYEDFKEVAVPLVKSVLQTFQCQSELVDLLDMWMNSAQNNIFPRFNNQQSTGSLLNTDSDASLVVVSQEQ